MGGSLQFPSTGEAFPGKTAFAEIFLGARLRLGHVTAKNLLPDGISPPFLGEFEENLVDWEKIGGGAF